MEALFFLKLIIFKKVSMCGENLPKAPKNLKNLSLLILLTGHTCSSSLQTYKRWLVRNLNLHKDIAEQHLKNPEQKENSQ